MSSFSYMSKYRTGYYLGVRSFLLRERRSVPDRVNALNAELKRIGVVSVAYEAVASEDGSVRATEERVGLQVTPNSSLEKLMRCYIAQGGNPLDISMFLIPDLNQQVSTSDSTVSLTVERMPYGGVAAPLSQEKHATNDGPLDDTTSVAAQKVAEAGEGVSFGEFPGGYLNLIKYPPRRLGKRKDPDEDSVSFAWEFDSIRKWANQEIRYKLHDLEERIIKLCDLREQLQTELDFTLTQAWGGLLPGLEYNWDEEVYVKERRIPESLVEIDKRLFFFSTFDAPLGGRLIPAASKVNIQGWFYLDDPSEELLDLMA